MGIFRRKWKDTKSEPRFFRDIQYSWFRYQPAAYVVWSRKAPDQLHDRKTFCDSRCDGIQLYNPKNIF